MKRFICVALILCLPACLAACAPGPAPETTTAPFDMGQFTEGLLQRDTPRDLEDYVLLWASYEWPEEFWDEMLLAIQGRMNAGYEVSGEGDTELKLYRIEAFGGVPYYTLDNAALARALRGKLTPSGERWLELEALERVAADGAFAVPYDTLAQRVLLWEAFERDHAAFNQQRIVTEHLSHEIFSLLFLYSYLYGIEKSPVYDEGGMLKPELRESYETFLANEKNKASAYYDGVQAAYGLWKENNWRYDDALWEKLSAGEGLPQL